ALFALASLNHIKTTLLFTSVLLVASLSRLRPYPSRVAYAIVAIVLPASILYTLHLQQILSLTGGTLDFSPDPTTVGAWILYLGPLLPLTFLGISDYLIIVLNGPKAVFWFGASSPLFLA